MKPRPVSALLLLLVGCWLLAHASDDKTALPGSAAPAHLSKETRIELMRAFTAELVYIRAVFPMGKKGLTLKDGVLSPSGQDLQNMIAMWGPAVKPGDEARLTSVVIKDDRIHFEINGGPIKKEKWYQRIQVGMGPTMGPVAPGDSNANPRGSYVDLIFDHYVPEMNAQQLKNLLHPVFDFDAKSALEAYLDTVPPKVKDAIKNHQVLVGMNREMVIYSKGRPPNKIREKDGETEYEDWIYGAPPQDVDFVRFVGDEVTRVEIMKVDGTKVVRTEKEINTQPQPTVAKASEAPRPANAPTLRRPGEEAPDDPARSTGASPLPPAAPPPSPSPGGGPD
jgi:hypothetical protein